MSIPVTGYLHRSDEPELNQRIVETHPGMAHWAGSGPARMTCRMCIHFQHAIERRLSDGRLGAARCGKYRQMVQKRGAKVPHTAKACRFFEVSDNPPLEFKQP